MTTPPSPRNPDRASGSSILLAGSTLIIFLMSLALLCGACRGEETSPAPPPEKTINDVAPGLTAEVECLENHDLAACERGCDDDATWGCLAIGDDRTRNHIDFVQALDGYQRACEGGTPEACAREASLRRRGLGAPVNITAAADLAQRACDLNVPLGCVELGVIADLGLGRPVDNKRAQKFYRDACDNGELEGCTRWGMMLRVGDGVDADVDEARSILQRACDEGAGSACAQLAQMHAIGIFSPMSDEALLGLFERGCADADAAGCEGALEVSIKKGRVHHDPLTVFSYAERACQLGSRLGCKRFSDFLRRTEGHSLEEASDEGAGVARVPGRRREGVLSTRAAPILLRPLLGQT